MERKISVLFSMVFLIFFSTSASATISTFYQGLTYPTGIAVHPNEHTLYVISGTSGSVWAIDINSNGSAGSLSLITESFSPNLDIDFDASGNLYGLGYGTDYIFRVTTTGVVDLCDVGSYDKGTAIAIEKPGLSTNKLYNSRENSLVLNWMYISDYNPNANANDQGYLSSCSTGFRFFHYRQSLNDIIATCEDKVVSVNPGSGACTDMITGMVQPNGIAVDTSGNVYVADTGTGQIKMKNILGVVKTIASGIDSPVGLAYDELTNNLFVAESGTGKILKISLSATEVCGEGIVFAYNPVTGRRAAFFSACDVPFGWAVTTVAPNWFLNGTGLKQPKITVIIPLGD